MACPRGFSVPPPHMVNADLVAFVRRVHAAAIPGGTLTSWYRDARRNLMCGGDPRSKHLRGLAIDYQPAQGRRLLDAIALRRSGLTVVDEGTHLHVQL